MSGRSRRPRRLVHRVVLLPAPPGAVYQAAESLGSGALRKRVALALAATFLVHAALAGLAVWGDAAHEKRPPPPAITRSVTLERIPPPQEPPRESTPPSSPPRPVRRAPPAAAQAGRVVTALEDPSKPMDLTQFTMPEGKSESYAGGFTAPAGTSAVAVNDPRARPRGVAGGTPGGSLARAPAPARRDWVCPWPDEEQSSDLREARVSVRIEVDRDGAAQHVEVLQSPTPAFAAAARVCARSERFSSARDEAGQSVAGTIPTLSIRFVR